MVIVKRLIQSDITKILIFFTLTIVSAAVISPWLYNMGKFIAEVGGARQLNGIMNWLAQKFASAEFSWFFIRALLISALLLAGPLIMWMQIGGSTPARPRPNPWRIRLPKRSIAHVCGQRLSRNSHALLHLVTGFLLAGSLLILTVWLLLNTGWFTLKHPVNWMTATRASLATAVLSALILEPLFRGVILGILLRAMRATPAIIIVSLLFALAHFLLPAKGLKILNPGELDAGFRMVTLIAHRFVNPQEFILSFVTLFVIGLILAYARYRTASLWLPIGLHAGWVFAHRIFQNITELSGDHLAAAQVFIGADRKSGLLPLCVLLSTGLLVHVFIQISMDRRKPKT